MDQRDRKEAQRDRKARVAQRDLKEAARDRKARVAQKDLKEAVRVARKGKGKEKAARKQAASTAVDLSSQTKRALAVSTTRSTPNTSASNTVRSVHVALSPSPAVLIS